jgi:hypothetical protein
MQTLLSRAIIFTLIHHHATDASQHRAEKKGNASCFAPPKQAPTNAGLKARLDGASVQYLHGGKHTSFLPSPWAKHCWVIPVVVIAQASSRILSLDGWKGRFSFDRPEILD